MVETASSPAGCMGWAMSFFRSHGPPADGRAGIARWLAPAGMALALGMLLFGALTALDARRQALREADRASENLAVALEREIGHTVSAYDLMLRGVAEGLELPGIDGLDPVLRRRALFGAVAALSHAGSVLVLDADGRVAADSDHPHPSGASYAGEDFFLRHRDHPGLGLLIGRPRPDMPMSGPPGGPARAPHGPFGVVLSRRVDRPDGGFGGVVLATLDLDFFQDLFAAPQLGKHGTISLAGSDGHLLVRHPYMRGAVDQDIGDSASFRASRSASHGRVLGVAATDGVERMFYYRHVGARPLTLFVAIAAGDVFDPWRNKALRLGGVMIGLCGATIALSLLVRRELLLRASAELGLRGAIAEMERLAGSDALTGLANRRAFDAALEHEWRRARRSGGPLALLLLDADHFKKYNDLYGHPRGDAVLRAIGGCLARAARRPGDLGARHGGEEFAMILPDTDLEGARGFAENLRRGVAALGIPHDATEAGRVSVSIGLAVMTPLSQGGATPAALVEEADRALYEAKRGGRDRVAWWAPPTDGANCILARVQAAAAADVPGASCNSCFEPARPSRPLSGQP